MNCSHPSTWGRYTAPPPPPVEYAVFSEVKFERDKLRRENEELRRKLNIWGRLETLLATAEPQAAAVGTTT